MTKHNPFKITHAAASAAILTACDAGALIQGGWHRRGDDGRELACLLGSIHPQVQSPADCNGDLMPMWLAELTPALFDGISAADVVPIARRFGGLVARWHALTDAQWSGILTRFLVSTIDDAVAAAKPLCEGMPYWAAVASACEQSKAAIISGDRAAARTAANAAANAARAAANAARAAAYQRLFNFLLDQIEGALSAIAEPDSLGG